VTNQKLRDENEQQQQQQKDENLLTNYAVEKLNQLFRNASSFKKGGSSE